MSLSAPSTFPPPPPGSPPPLPPLPFSLQLCSITPLPLSNAFLSPHKPYKKILSSCFGVTVAWPRYSPSLGFSLSPLSLSIFPVKYASPSRSTSRHSYPSVHLLCRVKYTSALEESAGRGFWRGSTGIWLSSSLGRGAQTFFYFGVFSSQSAAFIVLSHTAARRCTR